MMSKYCKKCLELNPNPLQIYCSSFCMTQVWYAFSKDERKKRNEERMRKAEIRKQKREKKKITPIWNKIRSKIKSWSKIPIAKFNIKTKQEIKQRDQRCIISWLEITDYHHVFYWTQSNKKANRNSRTQWVWLHFSIHNEIHHWIEWRSQEYRKKCIEYIFSLYSEEEVWVSRNVLERMSI